MCISNKNFNYHKTFGTLISASFWNIYGQILKVIGDKFPDPEFSRILEGSHIVGCAELHTENEALILWDVLTYTQRMRLSYCGMC